MGLLYVTREINRKDGLTVCDKRNQWQKWAYYMGRERSVARMGLWYVTRESSGKGGLIVCDERD